MVIKVSLFCLHEYDSARAELNTAEELFLNRGTKNNANKARTL